MIVQLIIYSSLKHTYVSALFDTDGLCQKISLYGKLKLETNQFVLHMPDYTMLLN